MPRARPVVPHVGGYANRSRPPLDATGSPRGASRWQLPQPPPPAVGCHGLAPWCLTLAATPTALVRRWMPRARPVVPHAGSYTNRSRPPLDATGSPRGASRWQLHQPLSSAVGCHGLVPWCLTLAATKPLAPAPRCHGLAPWCLTLKTLCQIEAEAGGLRSVKYHGPCPWHEEGGCAAGGSSQREAPRGKPVASSAAGEGSLLAYPTISFSSANRISSAVVCRFSFSIKRVR
jgi:hypothetical protein